jgi:hypothetical protein
MWKRDYHGVICSSEICYFEGSCASNSKKLSPLRFKFEEKKHFTLPSSEYLIEGKDMGVPGYCVFGV